ncbi:MAG: hypothetical protein COA43_12470 [Robiginitomaculum sp.]|nr:MAG: hypothetical protein COA43_12470 [Robiginitomaculum sp.]
MYKGKSATRLLPGIIILVLTIVTQVSSAAYNVFQSNHIAAHLPENIVTGNAYGVTRNIADIILPSALIIFVISFPFIVLGLWLGPKVNLGAPVWVGILQRQKGAWNMFLSNAKQAILWGLLLGALMVVLRILLLPYLPDEIPVFGHRGVIWGLLASVSAAIGEEVWFRLGLMTIAVWIMSRLRGGKDVPAKTMWVIIVLMALAFGAIHLPQLNAYNAAQPFAIGATILGNCVVGIFYGWLYWRRGLLAAITGHFAVDIAIHVVPALVPIF